MQEIKELTEILLDNFKKNRMVKKDEEEISCKSMQVPVGVSGRHLHLSEEHLRVLFGNGYELTPIKNLSQPGQFAAKEQVTLCGPKGVLEKVRIIGPIRGKTQVEILQSDAFKLGVPAKIRLSGDLEDTPGLTIIGPKGSVILEKGVIVAQRHIHMNPKQALDYGLKDGQVVSVMVSGIRGAILQNMLIRADEKGYLDCHIDMEEANALGLKNGSKVTIIK